MHHDYVVLRMQIQPFRRGSHGRGAARQWPLLLAASWLTSLVACSGAQAPDPASAADAAAAQRGTALSVPRELRVAELPRVRVASGLDNPRGMHLLPDGALLVATAGTGDPANPNTGALWRLQDVDGDGAYEGDGERSVVLTDQPSKNVLDIVRRDEVFGMGGMAEGDGTLLVSLAFFGGPSKILRVQSSGVTPWTTTAGNINALTFDPVRKAWYAVASTTDEVVKLREGTGSERVVKFPTLASGQDAVPGYLRHDPVSGELLVSLFSGSPEGEEGGDGTELIPRAASVVRVQPDTRVVQPLISDLTVPTDLVATPDGKLYVLEFCDAFLDPVNDRAALTKFGHGGFRRFSGRLLQVDRNTGEVIVVARGLDAPTNLLLVKGALYVAEGMGTPGRPIPGPNGEPTTLNGYIEKILLP